jgi:ABC-type sugar transport system ATPase subunit
MNDPIITKNKVPVLKVSNVRKSFGSIDALRGVNLEIQSHEIHALIGDNGAGKSTLVKIVAGVYSPDDGSIEVNGREVSFAVPREAEDAGIETVYQDLSLASSLDVGENVFLGREILYSGFLGRLGFIDRKSMRRKAQEQLEHLGIELPSLENEVGSLSGGQRQAVAVARAAIWGRSLLLMDEPTAALGVKQTGFVLHLMEQLRDKGLSILFITHNLPTVLSIANRVTVLRLGKEVMTTRVSDVTEDELVKAMMGFEGESNYWRNNP